MSQTVIRGTQILNNTVQRQDLDTSTVGQAVVTKLVQGTNVTLSSTGADSGTGDVTISVPGAVSANANNKATLGSDSLLLVQGTAAGVAATTHAQTVSGDDPQLTNARTPTAHQASHVTGSDQIPLASSSTKGLLNQTSGNTTDFIDGTNNSQPLQPVIWNATRRVFNAIGNPNFECDQITSGTTLSNVANGTRICDRWFFAKSGSVTGTINTQNNGNVSVKLPGTNYLISRAQQLFQVGTTQASLAAGDLVHFFQLIEGCQFRALSGDVNSLSLMIYSSIAPLTVALAIRDNPATKSIVYLLTVPTSGIWTLLTIPNIPAFPAGNFSVLPGAVGYQVSICLACGTTYQAPVTGTWQTGNYLGAPGMTNWLAAANSLWFAFVQHEPGAQCTTPIDCPFTQNLDDCLRYFQKTYSYATAIGTTTFAGDVETTALASQNIFTHVPFKRIMAKPPTITLYSAGAAAVNTVYDVLGALNRTTTGARDVGETGFGGASLTTPSGSAAIYAFHYTADTGW